MGEKDSDTAVFLLFFHLYVTDSKNLTSKLLKKLIMKKSSINGRFLHNPFTISLSTKKMRRRLK